jgi:hypothetical protein
MGSETGTPAARRKKLFAQADLVGLDRDERIELARVILHRDITSWSNLAPEQVDRMLDVFEGYEKISWLLANR